MTPSAPFLARAISGAHSAPTQAPKREPLSGAPCSGCCTMALINKHIPAARAGSGVTADNTRAALTPLLYCNYTGIMLFDN